MAVETQAFIDEVKTNGGPTKTAVDNMIKTLGPEVGQVLRQLELFQELLGTAEITEANEVVRGKMEEGFQIMGAVNRNGGELTRSGRDFMSAFRQLIQWYNGPGGFKEVAQAEGYVV